MSIALTLQKVADRFFTTLPGIGGGNALHAKQFLSAQNVFFKPLLRAWSLQLLLTSVSTSGALSFLFLFLCSAEVEEVEVPSIDLQAGVAMFS